MAEPVSTWVHEILELASAHLPRLVTKLIDAALAVPCPLGYQFWRVEYLISAPSRATNSTTAA